MFRQFPVAAWHRCVVSAQCCAYVQLLPRRYEASGLPSRLSTALQSQHMQQNMPTSDAIDFGHRSGRSSIWPSLALSKLLAGLPDLTDFSTAAAHADYLHLKVTEIALGSRIYWKTGQ